MDKRLTPEQTELYRRVDEVLHYVWDPLGVSGVPEARDEYYSYVPNVFSMLIKKVSTKEIVDFLNQTATQTMGLTDTEKGREHSKEVAAILENWRDVIHDSLKRDA